MKENNVTIREEDYIKYVKEYQSNVKRAFDVIYPMLPVSDLLFEIKKLRIQDDKWESHINQETCQRLLDSFSDFIWNQYQKENKNNWESWVMDDGTVLEMPEKYIIEMLCDWQAARYKFGGSTKKWFEENKSKMKLHPETMKQIEYWLEEFEPLWQKDMKKEKMNEYN